MSARSELSDLHIESSTPVEKVHNETLADAREKEKRFIEHLLSFEDFLDGLKLTKFQIRELKMRTEFIQRMYESHKNFNLVQSSLTRRESPSFQVVSDSFSSLITKALQVIENNELSTETKPIAPENACEPLSVEWTKFCEIFEYSISNNPFIDESDKLHFLKFCLRNKDMEEILIYQGKEFKPVWEAVKCRFSDSEIEKLYNGADNLRISKIVDEATQLKEMMISKDFESATSDEVKSSFEKVVSFANKVIETFKYKIESMNIYNKHVEPKLPTNPKLKNISLTMRNSI